MERVIQKGDLQQRAFALSVEVVRFTEESLPSDRPALWVIIRQLIRSTTSIGTNITEAKGSSTKKEYANFFHIALRSAHESRYWLLLLGELVPETEEISRMLGASIVTLKRG